MDKQKKRDIIFISCLSALIIIGLIAFTRLHHSENFLGFNTYVSDTQIEGRSKANKNPSQSIATEELELFLNSFIDSLYKKAQDYKKHRKVLDQLINAKTLKSPDYIDQNAKIMEDLIPQLRRKIDAVMSVFSKADKGFSSWMKSQPPAAASIAKKSWLSMRKQQYTLFVKYFDLEQDLFQQYQALMSLYQNNKAALYFDGNAVAITDAQLARQEQTIRSQIKSLKAQQSALFK